MKANFQCLTAFWFPCLIALLTLFNTSSFAITMSNQEVREKIKIVTTPSWVKEVSITAKSPKDLRTPTHYHLVERYTNVAPTPEEYQRYVYSITDTAGLADNSDITIDFNPDYESLSIHQIKIVRDGKVVNSFDGTDIKVMNSEKEQSDNIYTGLFTALIQLQNVQLGDTIDYSFSISGTNPVFDDKYSYFSSLAWGIEVDKVRVSVITPKARALNYKVYSSDAQVEVTQVDNNLQYSVKIDNAQEYLSEDDTPSWYYFEPLVQFSEYNDWSEVATWANQLFDISAPTTSEYTEFVSSLKKLPLEEAVNKAITFTQNDVRYLGLELGENSHRPHTPLEVFEKKYGDCKDKTLLLATLLKELGIKTDIALVSTYDKRSLVDFLPTHGLFNHVITKINYNGQSYWIDPTRTQQGADIKTMYQPDYEQALIVDKSTQALETVSLKNNIATKVEVSERIIASDYISPVEWQITSVFSGYEAESMRYRIKSNGEKSLAKQYLNYYAKLYPKIKTLAPLAIIDNLEQNQITVKEVYLTPDFWTLNDNQGTNFKLYADYPDQYLNSPKTIIREQPLALGMVREIEHSVTMLLPEDIDFSDELFSDSFSDEFISLTSEFKFDKRRLSFVNSFKRNATFVPVEKVGDYLTLMKKMKNQMSYRSSITNVVTEPGYEEMKNLIEHINIKRLAAKGSKVQ